MSRFEAVEPQKKKKHLRKVYRDRRDNLSIEEAAAASKSLCRRLAKSTRLADVQSLAGYVALGNEIDVRPYLTDCMERGVEIFLPRVIGPGAMEFCVISDWNDLQPGAFGIDEPVGPAADAASIEAFLVPGLAFDRRGHRLGFGKGFYDRALPSQSALIIGVGHHWQLVDEALPIEAHDRGVDAVVTDRQWHWPTGDGTPSQE